VQGLLDLRFYNETIKCERYVQVILGQFFSELTEKERLYGWFQQDSATAHTARMSMLALSDVFGGQNYQQWYLVSKFT
jgi:predicted transcriptional regulator